MNNLPQSLRRRADLPEEISPHALRSAADEIERLTRERDVARQEVIAFEDAVARIGSENAEQIYSAVRAALAKGE